MDAEDFSALVADVYDAALDPPSWRKVLKDICAFGRGGPSASLFWQDAVKRTGKTYYVWGGDPQYNQLYWDKYVGLNPFTNAAGHFPVGEIYSAADILPVPHVRRSAMIGKLINLSKVEAAALADTLDGLQAGMFLVDSGGKLMHANLAGRA